MLMGSRIVAAVAPVASMLVAVSAHAGTVVVRDLPEPATWALVGLAAVVGVVVSRNRRK